MRCISAIFSGVWLMATVSHGAEVITLSGSGTTNPSKCYWKIMNRFMENSRSPLWMSYRAIGSGNGIKEFLGINNTADFAYKSHNDFGSGDIPIPGDEYTAFKNNNPGKEIYHLPIVLGAISFFHSVPGVPDGRLGLNMTSCTLAKVFKKEILYWDDSEILIDNEGLKNLLQGKPRQEIRVLHRKYGSSSTASITQYLREGCPDHWPASMVGKEIDWPVSTIEVEGSGQMTRNIRDFPWSIGYIDAGHGHAENLVEIELQNANQNFLSSRTAMRLGGISAAANGIPTDLSGNFDGVHYLNKPGPNTWPIVAMSYIYVRKDLSSIVTNPHSQALLKAFLLALYDEEYISECAEYGFSTVPPDIKQLGVDAINALEVNTEAPTFIFEGDSTLLFEGQGPYVISNKVQRFSDINRKENGADLKSLKTRADQLEQNTKTLETAILNINAASGNTQHEHRVFTDSDYNNLMAALALGSVAFALWALTLFFFAVKKLCGL